MKWSSSAHVDKFSIIKANWGLHITDVRSTGDGTVPPVVAVVAYRATKPQ